VKTWNFGDSLENVFDMYGDSCENLFEIWAVEIILSAISSVVGAIGFQKTKSLHTLCVWTTGGFKPT